MTALTFGMVRNMSIKEIVEIIKDQLREGAIDELAYVKTLTLKQFNQLARQYAKEYIEGK
jgi:hypothetical protein